MSAAVMLACAVVLNVVAWRVLMRYRKWLDRHSPEGT